MRARADHFVGAALRDGLPVPPDGEWLVHEGPVELCASGLHFSRHPFDAMRWAPGATLCLVEVEDIVEEMADKGVCRRRLIVRRIDATELLRGYTRWCALQVVHLWDAPDVVRQYLETGDESLRSAAWSAAWSTSDTRGSAGATAAARAARAATATRTEWAAAPATATTTAWSVAMAVSGDDDAQRDEFARLVDEAFDAAGKEA
jgi:hypothetical protein